MADCPGAIQLAARTEVILPDSTTSLPYRNLLKHSRDSFLHAKKKPAKPEQLRGLFDWSMSRAFRTLEFAHRR